MLRVIVPLITLVLSVAVSPSVCGTERLGQRVFWKDSAQPRVGTRPVELASISCPATVTKVDGEWLWLERAWLRRTDVMTADEAMADWTEQLRRNPTSGAAYASRGIAWSEKGELENALADMTEAIRLDPTRAVTWNNRGHAWDQKGEHDNAIKDYSEAIRLKPDYAAAHANRALARLAAGSCADAIKDATEAIRLDPGRAHAYVVRASARFQSGEYERTVQDLETAMRLDATNPPAMDALAWLRATCPDASYRDGGRALELARKAGDLEAWSHPGNFDTLAAAHAEAGDFPAAVEAQAKAIALQAVTPATHKDRASYAAALERYKAGASYRDEPGVEQQ